MISITDDMLVDYLTGNATPAERETIVAELAEDPALEARLADVQLLVDDVRLAEEPLLPSAADQRFAAMLEAEMNRSETAKVSSLPVHRTWIRRLAAAAVVLMVFTVGYQMGVERNADKLSASRTLMLELMEAKRPSDRIRATTVALGMEKADASVLRDLSYLLRNDESPNVRLAALDALRRFDNDPAVADLLLGAVHADPPEVVRFELIETLVRMNETRLLPYLHDLMEADSLPQPVRDAAQLASFKLI